MYNNIQYYKEVSILVRACPYELEYLLSRAVLNLVRPHQFRGR